MKNSTLFLYLTVLLCSLFVKAQERVLVDFGSSNNGFPSAGTFNNITSSFQTGYSNGVLLFNHQGTSSGINLQVHDAWLNINSTGTTTPAAQLGIPQTASRDSFFGATGVFNGNTELTGGFKLRNLDPAKYYSFSFFASRMNVTDNRETLYTVAGSTTLTATLDAANNSSQHALVYNIIPDANGEITVIATAGGNNTNTSGFYYLNAMELRINASPINQWSVPVFLRLDHPSGNTVWETGKTVEVNWQSAAIDNLTIAFSTDGGSSFNNIATVPATDFSYRFIVPNQLSSNAMIRISSGTQTYDSTPIQVIPDDGTVYKIVVLGSSTAAGSGPSNLYNAWVWKYRKYLKELDTRYEVENLAQGGFVTYNILPTGTTIPAGINKTIDVHKNITKAVSINANGIIINLPSNDAASSYPVANQLHNYGLISQTASQSQIPLWVTTPQPRSFGLNSRQAMIQNQMVTETYNTFANNAVDFWTGIGNTTGNGMLLAYDSGDGVHATNEAHQIFYERLIAQNIHGTVKAAVDASLSMPELLEESNPIILYPNPVSDLVFIESDLYVTQIRIYNQLGQLVMEQRKSFDAMNLIDLIPGFYSIQIEANNSNYNYRLIKK